jgi:trehalose utilization protein
MPKPINVTIWNEFRHEKSDSRVAGIYPQGIHEALAKPLRLQADMAIHTATLDDPEHGLTDSVLARTDVLLWWGHRAHDEVTDAIVTKVQRCVLEGMGLIVLHSGHFSKIFRALMGTPCTLKWREANDKERVWNVLPAHPIAAGLPDYFELGAEEMYGEPFSIPTPDELVFISWFTGGEVFRSGATWHRGHGKVFYFRPGHESFPSYHNAHVQRVIANAIRWARPVLRAENRCTMSPPVE